MEHFPSFSIVYGDIKANISLDRFASQYREAQFWLDSQVMTDMVPYMPRQTGSFINLTRARSATLAGTGGVIAAAPPQGRFLYMGKLMVDPVTNSPWARKGAKKVTTERDLTYGNPAATPMWFDTAKQNHCNAWVSGVKKRAGGG